MASSKYKDLRALPSRTIKNFILANILKGIGDQAIWVSRSFSDSRHRYGCNTRDRYKLWAVLKLQFPGSTTTPRSTRSSKTLS
ncbi:unnamed protein product, partial [Nesidiocoris tenuis]